MTNTLSHFDTVKDFMDVSGTLVYFPGLGQPYTSDQLRDIADLLDTWKYAKEAEDDQEVLVDGC